MVLFDTGNLSYDLDMINICSLMYASERERDVPLWSERSLMTRWVVGSIIHGGLIELFLVQGSTPRLV